MRAIVRAIVIWLITAVAVAVAVWLVPGIGFVGDPALIDPEAGLEVSTLLSLVVFSAILALLNCSIKPLLKRISLPVTLITLGLFALVINAFMLYLTVWISGGLVTLFGNAVFSTGFYIESFWSALGAAIVIGVITAILNTITGVKHKQVDK